MREFLTYKTRGAVADADAILGPAVRGCAHRRAAPRCGGILGGRRGGPVCDRVSDCDRQSLATSP